MVKYLNTLKRYSNTSVSIWVFKYYLNTDIIQDICMVPTVRESQGKLLSQGKSGKVREN